MRVKKLAVIINPASGTDFPILSFLNRKFRERQLEVEYLITQKGGDARYLTQGALLRGAEAIVAYGGDGTIMEVAQVLCQTPTPLIIIPGGSANVMAKELGIPLNTADALKIFDQDELKIVKVDMGVCNGLSFLIRVHAGLMADVVTHTQRQYKQKVGQLAYSLAMLEQLGNVPTHQYRLLLPDQTLELEGLGIVVTNAGNSGISGISYLPDISITDGLLDVILIKKTDLPSLFMSVTSSAMTGNEPSVLARWQAPQLRLELLDEQNLILDDVVYPHNVLNVSLIPKALKIAL